MCEGEVSGRRKKRVDANAGAGAEILRTSRERIMRMRSKVSMQLVLRR